MRWLRAVPPVLAALALFAPNHSSLADNAPAVKPLTEADAAKLKPKDSFKECADCPEMVVIPAGKFTMGMPKDEPGREKWLEASESLYKNSGRPLHEVMFAKPFAMGKFTVTFAEWDACKADGGCAKWDPGNTGWGRGDQPVVNVNWYDAKAYVEWLSKKTGATYRLPSEAEWEYAARAGSTTPFWWGSAINPDQANYDATWAYLGGGKKGAHLKKTVPVHSFQPNPFGLYQVHGNVWELCEDPWHNDYRNAPTDGSVWTERGDERFRMLRGGSWDSYPDELRSSYRGRTLPQSHFINIGLRVVRNLSPSVNGK
jgi:formylglycine-generating enzyme required for sulfatase activity